MDGVITGSRTITENDWPSFLYDPALYDPARCKDQGLLRGHYLIRVSITIEYEQGIHVYS